MTAGILSDWQVVHAQSKMGNQGSARIFSLIQSATFYKKPMHIPDCAWNWGWQVSEAIHWLGVL